MNTHDLNSLSLGDLKSLQKSISKAIAEFDDREKSAARSALEAHAKELGFALSDLFDVAPQKKTRKSPEAKYRHPENQDVTWSGRGRKPRWFIENIESGKSADSMAI